jgi:tetratricopeptide (TPR) repeat protein
MASRCIARFRSFGLGAVLLLAAVFVVSILRMSHAAEVCAPVLARIVSLQGTVEFRPSESEPWTVAALGDQLCFDYWIRVGPFSRAALALPNDSVLRLDQQTTVRFRAQPEETRSLLDLFLGTLHLFSHRPRALEVDTPFVNAATEGTEFLLSVDADQTRIIVFEGRVLAQNSGGELLLASGEAAVAMAGEAPRSQIVARPRDAVAWTLYYPPVLAALAGGEGAARGLSPGLQAAIERVAANDYPGALSALDAVPDDARDARYYTYRAGVLLNVGRAPDARAAIDRALALDPQAGEALAERAIIAIVQDRRDEALADARRAVELSPESASARIALSYVQQANFQLEAARSTLREAVEIAPEDALAWARLAEIELSFRQVGSAMAAADRAVTLAPELSRTQTVLGFAALARIDVGEAKTAFERAIARDSADPMPRLGLGLAMIRQNDLEQGRKEIEVAVALDPDNSLLRSYLGKAFFEERRDDQAGEQYAIAKRLDPNDPTPWFYNAIRLQLGNRPVEALHELEKSIMLNDDRIVYRSRLLLDEDLATRGTSLARIYDTLNFEQLGVNEVAQSLAIDPANSAAHRFLSDLYVGKPRLEVARVSELLQAQMLQPVGQNPIQPSLAFTDLDLIARSGPAQVAFNEFTPLFTRDGVVVEATGVAGTDTTLGDEVAVTGLLNRTSLSVGQLHFQTQGFRENNDLDHNIYTVFGQSDLTEKVSLQAEYRHRDTDSGDRDLQFDLDDFDATARDSVEEDVYRGGARFTPAPGQTGLVSVIHADREDHLDSDAGGRRSNFDSDTDVTQVEGQYLGSFGPWRWVAGAGRAVADSRDSEVGFEDVREKSTANDIYAIANLALNPTLELAARMGYADVDNEEKEEDFRDQVGTETLTPGVGAIWQPIDGLRLRAAAGRTVKRPFVANQTLQPTQLAGFNELFDDLDGTRADWLGLAADVRASEAVRLGAEVTLRRLSREISFLGDAGEVGHKHTNERDDRAIAYLYWTPTDRIAASLELIAEDYSARARDDPRVLGVRTLSAPLQLLYTFPTGWFVTAQTAVVVQDVDLPGENAGQKTDLDSHGVLIDLAAGYRFPKRYGILALEIANLLDQHLSFQDESFRTSRGEVNPRFIPSRTFLATITLNF